MGLDMFLYAKQALYGSDLATPINAAVNAEWKQHGVKVVAGVGNAEFGNEITICVAYWRKAKAIHKWFVDNVQGGVDDCGSYNVSREKLETLRKACAAILANPSKAQELLPTQDGSFFGGTEYDDWYEECLRSTVDMIDALISIPERWYFVYQASW